jgi:hypothetical protein
VNIDAIDHLEFYVDDLEGSAFELCDAFGFRTCGSGGRKRFCPAAAYEAVHRQQESVQH